MTILSRLGAPGSLRRRAIFSAAWQFVGMMGARILRLGGNLALTRLLAPEAFGLIATVLAIQTGLLLVTDFGIRQAIVRSAHSDDPRFLRTAWTFQVLQYLVVSGLIVLVAGGLGVAQTAFDFGDTVYADPSLPLLIAAITLSLVIRGFGTVNAAMAQRRLAVSRVVMIEIVGDAIGVTARIVFALIDPTVWALLWGGVVTVLAKVAMQYLLLPGPSMRFAWERSYAVELWGFGKWLAGSSALTFVAQQGDKLILGALLGVETFSMYAIARIWIDAAQQTLNRASNSVGLATISEVARKAPERVAGAFRKFRLFQGALCAGLFLFFAVFGVTFIDLLYPARYQPVGPILILLSPLFLVMIFDPFANLLLNAGRSREIAWISLIRAVALVVTLLAVDLVGEEHLIFFAVATARVWGTPLQLRFARETTEFNLQREYALLAVLVIGSLLLTTWLETQRLPLF